MLSRQILILIVLAMWLNILFASCSQTSGIFDASESTPLTEPNRATHEDSLDIHPNASEPPKSSDTSQSENSPHHTQEPHVTESSLNNNLPDYRSVPQVTLPKSQRLCIANPEIHGTNEFARSQLTWMA